MHEGDGTVPPTGAGGAHSAGEPAPSHGPLGPEAKLWAAGLVVLFADASSTAGLGLAARSDAADVQGPILVLILAVTLFFVPLEVALRMPQARRRWLFWSGTAILAAAWAPALPFVFLAAGPSLGSPVGLALAGMAMLGALLTLVGGIGAAVEAARREARGKLPGR